MGTAIICIILIIICIIGIKSSIKRVAHGCCGSGGDSLKKIKVEDKDLSHYPYKYVIRVEGMTCNNCKKRVENALNELNNVYAMVNLKENTATIYMKEEIPFGEIRKVISKAGYEAGEKMQ